MDQKANDTGLNLVEANTHSFIVKIWLEETVEEAGRATWRGHITHVPSGKGRYLKDLGDIVIFIVPFLEGIGLMLDLYWRMRLSLMQPRRRMTKPN